MFNKTKAREKKMINEIKKGMKEDSMLKYLALNAIKNEAAILLINKKISGEFYEKVFFTKNGNHYTEENFDYIMNY